MHKTLAFKVTHLRTPHRIPYYQQLITVIPSILKSLTLDQHYNSLTHGILSNTFYIHPKCILHVALKQPPRENLLHIQNMLTAKTSVADTPHEIPGCRRPSVLERLTSIGDSSSRTGPGTDQDLEHDFLCFKK